MSDLLPIYELETAIDIDENHLLMVYQDKRLKALNVRDIFYSQEEINENIINPKNDIINSMLNMGIDIPSDVTLKDLINYTDTNDFFEIGVREMVNVGAINDAPYTSIDKDKVYPNIGHHENNSELYRCIKMGNMMTVISPNKLDILQANFNMIDGNNNITICRNDFYGGEFADNRWKNGIYPWNKMKLVKLNGTDGMEFIDVSEDETVDDNCNYFIEVPLYFIKEEYVVDSNGIDITSVWPKASTVFCTTRTSLHTEQCLPSVRPVVVQVGATAISIISV